MSAHGGRFWRSFYPVFRRPLVHQPFIIAAVVLRALVWTAVATAICTARFVTVVAGLSAFVGGIVLCLVGYGYLGAPIGVAGLVASRLAA